MSNMHVRSPHYQRHYQSMLLNLYSIYPHFETDGFDRAYIAELASVTSQYPATGLDFCYYWTEKVLWDRFQLSSAYGEFPGRYSGPGYITQQQIGCIEMPPTTALAQQVSRMAPTSLQQTLEVPSCTAGPAEPISEQASEVPKAYGTPASSPAQTSQDLAGSSRNPQAICETPGLTVKPDVQIETPSSLLAARLASPGTPNPSSVSTVTLSVPLTSFEPLPPLLDPDLLYKDPTTGELIT